MTREQWAKLTDDEKRIKVHEVRGFIRVFGNAEDGDDPDFYVWFKDGEEAESAPDYLNDLNAMHEVEKLMSHELTATWVSNLSVVVHGEDWYRTISMMQATAAQRAEAFVLTMEKGGD